MIIEYVGVKEINGSLIAIDGIKNASFEEMVTIRLANGSERTGRIVQMEGELSLIHISLYAIIDGTKGELHKQLISLCGSQVEAQNVSRIIRMKAYFGASPDVIRANLLPWGRSIPRRVMDDMLEAGSPQEVLDIYYATTAGRQIPEEQRAFSHDLYHLSLIHI